MRSAGRGGGAAATGTARAMAKTSRTAMDRILSSFLPFPWFWVETLNSEGPEESVPTYPGTRGRAGVTGRRGLPALRRLEEDPLLADLLQAMGILGRESFLAETIDLGRRSARAPQAVPDRAHEGEPVPAPDGDADIWIERRYGRHHPHQHHDREARSVSNLPYYPSTGTLAPNFRRGGA